MSEQTYRRQLANLVRAMSQDGVSTSPRLTRVKPFLDDSSKRRFDNIRTQLGFVAESFDHFDDLIANFIRACPLAAYDNGASDRERMLNWLTATRTLSPQQQDFVACQRARYAIEEMVRQNRSSQRRFQDLSRLSSQSGCQLPMNRAQSVHLNPIRTWARFVSEALLDGHAAPPANVLFFAVRDEIETAILQLEGQALINELAEFQPCTLDEWSALSATGDSNVLMEFSSDLAKIGLVAFG